MTEACKQRANNEQRNSMISRSIPIQRRNRREQVDFYNSADTYHPGPQTLPCPDSLVKSNSPLPSPPAPTPPQPRVPHSQQRQINLPNHPDTSLQLLPPPLTPAPPRLRRPLNQPQTQPKPPTPPPTAPLTTPRRPFALPDPRAAPRRRQRRRRMLRLGRVPGHPEHACERGTGAG